MRAASTGRALIAARTPRSIAWRGPIAPIRSGRCGLVESRAEIVDAQTVRLLATGETLRAKRFSSQSALAPALQPAFRGWAFHHLERGLRSAAAAGAGLVIGAGYYSAVEFAGIFAGLGSKTTLVHRGDKLLRGFRRRSRTRLGEAYAARGIEVKYSTTPLRIEKQEDGTVS